MRRHINLQYHRASLHDSSERLRYLPTVLLHRIDILRVYEQVMKCVANL